MWITPHFTRKSWPSPPYMIFQKSQPPYEGVHITMSYFYWRRSGIFFIAYLAAPEPRAVEEETVSLT